MQIQDDEERWQVPNDLQVNSLNQEFCIRGRIWNISVNVPVTKRGSHVESSGGEVLCDDVWDLPMIICDL